MSQPTEQLNIEGVNEEIVHETTIFAEPIFHVGNFKITNSLFNSWIVVLIIVLVALVLRKKASLVPRGVQNIFEMIIDGFLGVFDSITGSRNKSLKFFPLVFSFFIFILINNWLGLLPGIGSVGQIVSEHGKNIFIPYLRAGTADLNTTLALAAIAVAASHIIGILAIGAWSYLNKFINIKVILEIPKRILKEPVILLINPIKVFVGLVEIIGELAKVASLSFRLFGNIFAGEVLLASMSAILAFGLPIPFMFLEVLVGLIQAFVFAILILVYLSMMTTVEEH